MALSSEFSGWTYDASSRRDGWLLFKLKGCSLWWFYVGEVKVVNGPWISNDSVKVFLYVLRMLYDKFKNLLTSSKKAVSTREHLLTGWHLNIDIPKGSSMAALAQSTMAWWNSNPWDHLKIEKQTVGIRSESHQIVRINIERMKISFVRNAFRVDPVATDCDAIILDWLIFQSKGFQCKPIWILEKIRFEYAKAIIWRGSDRRNLYKRNVKTSQ